MGKIACIIDGDVVAYRSAAANESRSIKATHKETGVVTTHAHRTALKEHIKGTFDMDEFEIEDVQTAGDVSHALHAVKTTIESLCRSCWADSYEIYLSGETNFRDRLPLPTRYKSSRTDNLKPLQLAQCREYLIKSHQAIRAVDCEADDMLAHKAWEGNKQKVKNIICTIDKDAYGVDSWLYNWTKMEDPIRIKGLGDIELDERKVLRGQGRKWFYAQWVKGDVTDCFKPCELSGKKFGDVACFNLLKDCKTDKECVEAVYKQYKAWYPKPITYKAWDGIEYTKNCIEIMDMYAACAHMKRWPTDIFDTKKLLNTLEITHE